MAQSNKVYLNPKFNEVIKTNISHQQKNVMHINPLFAFRKQSLPQNVTAPKPRIYVNPNFMSTKSNQNVVNKPQYDAVSNKYSLKTKNLSILKVDTMPVNCNVFDSFVIKSTASCNQKLDGVPVNSVVQSYNPKAHNAVTNQASTPLLKTTRYSLVRQNDKKALIRETENTAGKLPIKVTKTVKINKFKSVKLEDLKKSFNTSGTNNSTFNNKEFLFTRCSKDDVIDNLGPRPQNIDTQRKRSRYCLVRSKNKNAVSQIVSKKLLKNPAMSPSIRCCKKELNISNNRSKYNFKNISLLKVNKGLTPNQKIVYKIHDRFRIVKENTPIACTSSNSKNRRMSLVTKSTKIKNQIQRSCRKGEMNKFAKFNKNNIPCPLYRKYGKCIRNIDGNCRFLHDKKHVSICRKFLKGVCHDKECLFSHDITSKKMPTCYYYLKGICTKEDCPYLHVKLNVNAKICTDFTRGFCEKGENCLYRHINVCPNLALKGKCVSERGLLPHKVLRNFKAQSSNKIKYSETLKDTVIIIKKTKENFKESILTSNSHDVKSTKTELDDKVIETRYYKDAISDNTDSVVCENIKPTRVKLGTLPSFIHLKK